LTDFYVSYFVVIFLFIAAEDESRNRYKLFLECTLILTSVVPPELPIELSLAVNHSLLALQKLGIFCTEPFRIPFAGKVDICCFDKTGTLTSDNLIVEGVTAPNSGVEICPYPELPVETRRVLASCHSLVKMEDEVIGDPLEKACLAYAEWVLTRNDSVIPTKGNDLPLHIIHRYHFSSSLKRMSVIASYISNNSANVTYFAVTKGAPEILKSRFVEKPKNYDELFQKMSREGARVLALGYKELGVLTLQEVKKISRSEIESGLVFCGFLVMTCPLKSDSKRVMQEILCSNHKALIITGDNPLTAAHVAKELNFFDPTKTVLILNEPKNSIDDEWMWISVDRSVRIPLVPLQGSNYLVSSFELCVTGAALNVLLSVNRTFFDAILPHIKVFARTTPKQKELVINNLKLNGFVTLMCGDGTNDVGALKHADVGVALLSHPLPASKSKAATSEGRHRRHINASSDDRKRKDHIKSAGSHPHRINNAAAFQKIKNASSSLEPRVSETSKKLEKLLKEMEESEDVQVRLGDASVAAPFTSKYSSISSICHIIKQGRCTLVTTLQMFKILALNALILAYSQSVLYLDGVKFSDTQATVQGLLLAACFFFISRSKPLKSLAKQRPLSNIFNIYTLATISTQFLVHFFVLVYLVQQAHELDILHETEKVDLDAKFKPSLINTTVYVVSVILQTSTFAVNYHGRPFMESITENKGLLYSLALPSVMVGVLAAGLMPEMTVKFELVSLPAEVRDRFHLWSFVILVAMVFIVIPSAYQKFDRNQTDAI
uniref:Cation-transporting ATPase n=1 Tax=Soboliphyme baturini TaxID=241478 RepID=A0A183IPH8_9BILA